mgnify:CR=1 FL=1
MGKAKLNATIDKELFDKWISYCNDRFINRSKLLERVIHDYLENEGIVKKKEKRGRNG